MRHARLLGLTLVFAAAITAGCSSDDEPESGSTCQELGLCTAGAAGAPSAVAGSGAAGRSGASGAPQFGGSGGAGVAGSPSLGGSVGVAGSEPIGNAGSAGAAVGEACPGGRVDGARAQELVAQGAVLLDVRTPAEYATEHLPGAINIPVDEMPTRMSELPTDTPIVTYCQSGTRSGIAAAQLMGAGYLVCDLGPMSAWSS